MRHLSPNNVTVARILLIPIVVVALVTTIPYGTEIALVVFAIAALSDGVDGYLARSRNQVTVLGTFLDPLADKLLMTAALVSLVQLGKLEAWVVIIILTREFAVTGLRLVAAAEGMVISASWFGKLKTAAQILAVLVLIPDFVSDTVVDVAVVAAVVVTVLSGVEYFWVNREQLRQSTSQQTPG